MLAVCGCNQLLGVQQTQLYDGRPTPMCPSIGTLPTLYGDTHELPAAGCTSYRVGSDVDIAIARCTLQAISRGPIDQMLTPVVMDPIGYIYNGPHVAPEGTSMFIAYNDVSTQRPQLREFDLQPDDSWRTGIEVALPAPSRLAAYTPPTHGPDRRIVYEIADGAATSLEELSSVDGGPWQEAMRYPMTELGIHNSTPFALEQPSMTPDGLRLLFVGSYTEPGPTIVNGVFYADRVDIDQHFGVAQMLDRVPRDAREPYMTANCGRVYYTGLGAVYYVE